MLLASHSSTTSCLWKLLNFRVSPPRKTKIPEGIPISKAYESEEIYTVGQRWFNSFFFSPENDSPNRILLFDRDILSCGLTNS